MIHVYEPDLKGREREYLIDAFDSSWISSRGGYLEKFEAACADLTGVPFVATVSNGTVALHLALHCLDLKVGDEVIVPSMTYIASVNTITQTGATPVFVDSNADDWQVDCGRVAEAITPRTKAILPVHLYGGACDMDELVQLAQRENIKIVEDCAEALGTTYKGRHVGSFGDVGTFSFFGNKTITTGEGGLVVTSNADLHRKMTIVKGQGQDPARRYWHSELGFNYRMTNLCAAIGLAQIERIDAILDRKRAIARRYRDNLKNTDVTFQKFPDYVKSSEWLITLLLPPGLDREQVMARMAEAGVETRPTFYCAHHMPAHHRPDLSLPVAEDIARRGVSLPSYPALADDEIDMVCDRLIKIIKDCRAS